MTELERYCIGALRLSEASAEALKDELELKIRIARAEMIRSGIPEEIANDDENALVINVIIKYVTSEMDSVENERIKAYEAFRLCMDELRKSVIEDV